MVTNENERPLNRRRFRTVWSELDYLCKKTHHWLYTKNDPISARRFLSRLKAVLGRLPENDKAILYEEGAALLYELDGNIGAAIEHRRREIKLMKELYMDISTHNYDRDTIEYMLYDRDKGVLSERQSILRSLEEKTGQRKRG